MRLKDLYETEHDEIPTWKNIDDLYEVTANNIHLENDCIPITVSIDKLWPGQTDVWKDGVEKYEKNGFTDRPVVAIMGTDPSDVRVIDGHHRIMSLIRKGIKTVDVLLTEYVDEDENGPVWQKPLPNKYRKLLA